MVTVAETATIGDIRDALIGMTQQMARFNQAQTVQIALGRQPGLLLQLTMQGPERQRKIIASVSQQTSSAKWSSSQAIS